MGWKVNFKAPALLKGGVFIARIFWTNLTRVLVLLTL